MKRLELLIPPPLIMLLVGLMMGTSARLFPALNLASPNNHMVAVAVALLGVAMSLVSIVAFKRARTTTDPRRPALASNLINSGIYRYSRNPMYLGVLLVLAGWAVYLGNVLSILGLLVFIAYITRFQIIPEERLLSQKFGVAFENYMKEVRRWL
ncbi:MAG: isoprenylcysteine carboxylmethyltransferase family protein [Candidimonas sp.]|nr:isoprenylcysteine carboxylmethyltransferase family protein [Candidimonas sp.]NYT44535.1 isoprenylcysteine carboxylmethyltransferase family protein [Alcaligenaceae bacterium]